MKEKGSSAKFKKDMARAQRKRREVCKLLDAKPFRPFALTFASGKSLIVSDRVNVLVTRLGISIGVPQCKGSRLMNIVHLCGFYNLKSIEKNVKRSKR